MKRDKLRKIVASAAVISTLFSTTISYATTTNINSASSLQSSSITNEGANVLSVNVEDDGTLSYSLPNSEEDLENKAFSWDNASVYFTITDRFNNGNTSNDHSYGRSVGEVDADNYQNRLGTFHGGDLEGLTDKINEGYFNDLGVNAIWITAPYEQIHGALCSNGFKHYAYHGYYTLDYSNVDANMGTAEDLETFIDTAHEHGIRVVFDVVMNHAGYADAVTANEYGFGGLSSNWRDIYYNWNESNYNWYNDYAGEAASNGSVGMMQYDADWQTNWWGSDWIRAISTRFKGYEGSESGDEKTMCLSGLPDFKTESTKEVSLPGILKVKWQREGRYNQEMQELNEFFSSTGKPRTVPNYIIKWLTDWVREYGVDGFRCDTAKHIDVSLWKDLKDEANSALNEWRENNPDKPGAQWTDDFWMTGESWGHGVGKDHYYTSGGFDSMINFSFQSAALTSSSSIDGIFSDYANKINSDDSFNVLSYISSHDKGLTRGDMITAGTNLLLLPGGIQIYYGDETNRQSTNNSTEQSWRSQMNWDTMDKTVLEHWQKIGQFRNDHIAVGAGTHTKISTSPYTFSRVYEENGEVVDKVVIALAGTSGTHTISVGSVFNDGDGVRDAYTGKEYTVSNGEVTVEAGKYGVILLESNGVVTPSIGISPKSKDYYTDTLEVRLSCTKGVTAYYSIDGGEKIQYTNGTKLNIGEGTEIGDVTKVVVTGIDADGNEVTTKEASYTRIPEPDGLTVHVKNTSWSGTPNIYVYSGDGASATEYAGSWPGEAMTDEGDGWYSYETKDTISAKVIFNGSFGQYPGAQQPGLDCEGEVWILNNEFVDGSGEIGKVIVKYIDADTGKEIAESKTIKGTVGTAYSIAAESIKGYAVSTTPNNVSGKYTKEDITVIFEYKVSAGLTVHVKNASWSGTPNIYVYTGEGNSATKYAGAWPGTAMESEGDGWYVYNTSDVEEAKVIFNGSFGQYPASQQPGIDCKGEVWVLNNKVYNTKPIENNKLTVHVKNTSWSGTPNIYVYTGEGNSATKYAGTWPGTAMKSEGDGWYVYNTTEVDAAKVIFNGSFGQYPAAQQPGIDCEGEVWILNNKVYTSNPTASSASLTILPSLVYASPRSLLAA